MEQDWTPSFELEGATVRTNEIKFKKPLYEDGVGSAIYLASIRGKEFALRLHGIYLYDPYDGLPCKKEFKAFKRPKARGLCEKGYIPQCHGMISNLD
ncbi:hypothetical protein SI65_08048 [Aspergillus cristatus]|uniref:Uncharacterized protein n=1 Tax=Aspergillus cristatus TaxID=573508 RepID=A0A1E3B6X6_ASPCR|nr:hypothetical protein SI65_08048 [Aspergillus cristatus]